MSSSSVERSEFTLSCMDFTRARVIGSLGGNVGHGVASTVGGAASDGLRRLLLRFDEGRSCSRSRSDFWSSSVWWTEGGRSRMSDPRCVEHWRVSRLIFSTRSIGSALGGPPMQLLKPGWARVLHRVRRGSLAKCGDVEDCSLTRDLLVISRFWRVFLDVFGHVSFSVFRFDRLLACVRCNLSV
jgi:hypothetical protein